MQAAHSRFGNPVESGQLKFDTKANQAREAGIAKQLLTQKLSVIVLGGEHDLTDHLPPEVEYIRVTLSAYREASGQK